MQLPDGTIVPSFIPMDRGQESMTIPGEGEFGLKVGTIVKIYYPDDPDNIRKNCIEYDVKVGEKDGRKGFNISPYKHCVCADVFGGMADSLEFTHRPSTDLTLPNALYQTGNKVLVLCLHGDTNAGVIVGGVRNIRRQEKSNSEQGHFLHFQFNGVDISINKDGEMTLTYKSATDIQGAPQDPESGGTFIKVDKTGSIELNDNKATKIRLDKATSDITIETTKGNVIVNAQKNVQETALDSVLVAAENAIREIAKGNVVTNAPEIKVGGDGANEPMVLGNQLVTFLNTQVVPKINALILAVTTLADSTTGYPLHKHSYNPGPGASTDTGGPTPSASGASGQIPSAAAPSGAPQLSDFCFVKKTYSS